MKHRNESGFAVLALCMVVSAVMLLTLIPAYRSNLWMASSLNRENLVNQEKINIVNALTMVLQEGGVCKTSIPSGLGENVQALQALSSSNKLKFLVPTSTTPATLIEPGANFGNAKIESLAFEVQPATFLGQSHAAELTVVFRLKTDPQGSGIGHRVTIPFYVVTDDWMNLKDCKATAFWNGDADYCSTIEDHACQVSFATGATADKAFKYQPDLNTCTMVQTDANKRPIPKSSSRCVTPTQVAGP